MNGGIQSISRKLYDDADHGSVGSDLGVTSDYLEYEVIEKGSAGFTWNRYETGCH